MIILRRRLIFWLIKAYLKRWGKSILLYFGIGLLIFIVLHYALRLFTIEFPFFQKEVVGMVGAHTTDDLPSEILYKVSRGLTKVEKDGTVKPDIAYKWVIANSGKTYVFYLKDNVYFSDGENLTSDLVRYGFSDVSVDRPNKHTIVYTLKDKYSPFLITASRPIFKKGFVGISEHKVKNIKLNGTFIQSIDLYSLKTKKTLTYQFYPTEESLKMAFILGEISKATDIQDIKFKNSSFYSFKNSKVEKKVNYQKLVTLFYNTQDKNLSNKNLREGLSYTIPNSFGEGIRNAGPFRPFSFVNQDRLNDIYQQDLTHAKLLLDKVLTGNDSSKITLSISTLPQYAQIANTLSSIWKKLGVDVKIKLVDSVPPNFQIFLGEFNPPIDPDQYTLWHSQQTSNITNYKNLRIDKLLEDGRQINDMEERKKIYGDFQKYLLSDAPASFLFFPYAYEITRE